jgi:hypothetical protein
MIVSMMNDQGQEVSPETFLLHTSHTGERAEVDYFVIREALGLLGTLRQRDPNLCVITAIGAETLSDNGTLRAIIDLMLERREMFRRDLSSKSPMWCWQVFLSRRSRVWRFSRVRVFLWRWPALRLRARTLARSANSTCAM